MTEALAARVAGRRVGLFASAVARWPGGRDALAVVREAGPAALVVLAPEHGVSGVLAPGETDAAGAVVPFYGHGAAAAAARIPALDLLVFDLPLVGARYYTYIDGLRRLLVLGRDRGVPVLVVERENPLGLTRLEGPIPAATGAADVVAVELPIRYGLTTGELARFMATREGAPEPEVVEGPGGAAAFSPPSPNLRSPEAVALYPATCLLEGTTVSEGRGTEAPFVTVGAPGLDPERLMARLPATEGLAVEAVGFVPAGSKHAGRACRGIRVRVDRTRLGDVLPWGAALLAGAKAAWPEGFGFARGPSGRWFLDLLWGGPALREAIEAGRDPAELFRPGREPVGWRQAWRVPRPGPVTVLEACA